MTLRQGLCDITWSDINIHATLGRYITNHATWIYYEVFSTQNLVPNMKILFASKTFSLLQEYFDEIVYWHFQNQA